MTSLSLIGCADRVDAKKAENIITRIRPQKSWHPNPATAAARYCSRHLNLALRTAVYALTPLPYPLSDHPPKVSSPAAGK
jgi:hypothetical protein